MGWQRNYVVLKTDERVRFTLLNRPGSSVYFVRFKTADGRRLEKATGAAKKPDAIDAAQRVILEEYQQVAPTSETVTWDIAAAMLRSKMTAQHNRPITIDGYVGALGLLRGLLPLCKDPAEVTDRHAQDFKVKYGQGRFTRKRNVNEGEVAPTYARKAKSLDSRIRTLKAVFEHFRTMNPPLVDLNPFDKVTAPKLDREVKLVQKTDVGDVFEWLEPVMNLGEQLGPNDGA